MKRILRQATNYAIAFCIFTLAFVLYTKGALPVFDQWCAVATLATAYVTCLVYRHLYERASEDLICAADFIEASATDEEQARDAGWHAGYSYGYDKAQKIGVEWYRTEGYQHGYNKGKLDALATKAPPPAVNKKTTN